jgi:putative transposase
MISAANLGDREGLEWFLNSASKQKALPRILWADHGYSGNTVIQKAKSLGVKLEIVSRKIGLYRDTLKLKSLEGFHIVPKRWIVERTFAWFGKFRRLSKDYELSVSTSTVMIYLAMTRIMLRRIACLT